MPTQLALILSAALNMAVFGAIIYGALARSKGTAVAIKAAVLLPASFNIAICGLKASLDFEARAIGIATTVVVATLILIFANLRGVFPSGQCRNGS